MQINEIIDLSIRVYQSLGWPILKATASAAVFMFAGLAFLFDFVFPMFGVTSNASDINVQVGEAVLVVILAICVAAPISLLGLSYATGVIVKFVADYMNGSIPDPDAARRAGQTTLWRLFGVHLFELVVGWAGVLLSIGLLMVSAVINSTANQNDASSADLSALAAGLAIFGFIIGFLWLAIVLSRHALTPAIAVIEQAKPMAAAKRSAQLLKAFGSHPSGYGVLFTLICVILILLLLVWPGISAGTAMLSMEDRLESAIGIPYVGSVLIFVVRMAPLYLTVWVLAPVWCATTTILYYERRVRVEGYDVQALAKDAHRHQKSTRFEL